MEPTDDDNGAAGARSGLNDELERICNEVIESMSYGYKDFEFAMEVAKRAAVFEREACARVCDVEAAEWRGPKYSYAAAVGEHCANKIRMRSEPAFNETLAKRRESRDFKS